MNGVTVVYRDRHGVEYVSVPLPTHEVTDAIPLTARIVSKRAPKRSLPLYEGSDGAELAYQPHSHRRRWTDEQWVAFKEYQQLEADLSRRDEPIAAVMIVKPTS